MSLIVAGVGVLVFVYAARYFAADAPDLGRLAGLLVLFAGSMLGLVQADQVIVLYTGWELTTVTSFLLIGNRHTESRARAAALHALLVTSAGGLALLGGLVLLGQETGTYRLSESSQTRRPSGAARPPRWCWCSSARSRSRPSTPSTPGCPARWRRRPRSAPTSTRRRW